MKKGVIILSGGLDSTVLLHYLLALGFELHALTFNYNQRHKREIEFAQYWGEKSCESWQLVDIPFLQKIASNSALTNPDKELPQEHYSHENQKITVVPNRNMVMLSIAVAHAENLGIKEVFYGAHKGDNQTYPDCRPGFAHAMSHAAVLGTYNKVEVRAPFVNLSKAQIVQHGLEAGVDFTKTWSCYAGGDQPCGTCSTCQARLEAFTENQQIDPVTYATALGA